LFPLQVFPQGTALNRADLSAYLANVEKAKEDEDKVSLVEAYNKIAFVYWERGMNDEALEYFQQCKQLNEELGNIQALLTIYTSLGLVFTDMQDNEKALFYFQKAFQLSEELGNTKIKMESLLNLSQALFRLGRYDEAVRNIEDLIEQSKEAKNYRLLRMCYGRLADIYKTIGDSDKAYKYVELYTSFNSHEIKEQKSQLEDASRKLQQTQSEISKSKELLISKDDELERVKEGLSQMEQMAQAKQMEIDLLLKDKIIQDLRIREQEAQLRIERIVRIILVVGLLIISIFGFTVYILYVKIKDKDKRLVESTHVFVELFRQAQDAFVLVESDKISDCNNAFLRYSFYSKNEDLVGRRLVDCFSFNDKELKRIEIEQAQQKALQMGRASVDVEVEVGGNLVFVRLLFNGFKSSEGKLVFVLFSDLSGDMRKQLDLIHSKNSLKELVLEKTYELEDVKLVANEKDRINNLMLSSLGSELRSPLSAILGVSKLLRDSGELSDNLKEALWVVNESARKMNQVIEDWFDQTESEPVGTRVKLQEFDTKIFITATEKLIREEIPDGYTFSVVHKSNLPKTVKCDVNIKQVFLRVVKYIAHSVQKQHVEMTLSEANGKFFADFEVSGEVNIPQSSSDISETSMKFSKETQTLFKPVMQILTNHGGAIKVEPQEGKTKLSFFFVDGGALN